MQILMKDFVNRREEKNWCGFNHNPSLIQSNFMQINYCNYRNNVRKDYL